MDIVLAGSKVRKLEVGAMRAPRLLVLNKRNPNDEGKSKCGKERMRRLLIG